MNKQRSIFLFAAGAAIDWQGPTTDELTELVRKSGFKIVNSETTITEYLYQKLIEAGNLEEEVNFETLINVIEEFIVYFSEYNSANQTPSLLRTFISEFDLGVILNFSIEGGKRKHGYRLQIPKGSEYRFSNYSYYDENPHQFFFQHLLSTILTEINIRISNYSYHSDSSSFININSEISFLFKAWIKSIEKNSLLRMYTLNYDRIFKILLEDIEIDCFEGFAIPDKELDINGIRADIPKIINNEDSNCYYNLHGSAYWKVSPSDFSGLPNPEIVFTGYPELPINNEQAIVQIEKGKPLFLTNIITGYQKAQKGMISPFKQMHSTFDRDCCNANSIYLVGYSFGDEHINESLKIALRYNNNLKLEIVNPNFFNDELDKKLVLNLFPYLENELFNPKRISENIISYFSDRIVVYTLYFKDYLAHKKG